MTVTIPQAIVHLQELKTRVLNFVHPNQNAAEMYDQIIEYLQELKERREQEQAKTVDVQYVGDGVKILKYRSYE